MFHHFVSFFVCAMMKRYKSEAYYWCCCHCSFLAHNWWSSSWFITVISFHLYTNHRVYCFLGKFIEHKFTASLAWRSKAYVCHQIWFCYHDDVIFMEGFRLSSSPVKQLKFKSKNKSIFFIAKFSHFFFYFSKLTNTKVRSSYSLLNLFYTINKEGFNINCWKRLYTEINSSSICFLYFHQILIFFYIISGRFFIRNFLNFYLHIQERGFV